MLQEYFIRETIQTGYLPHYFIPELIYNIQIITDFNAAFQNKLSHKGCFTIRVHFQKLHSSPVLPVEAYFDFKVLLPKH